MGLSGGGEVTAEGDVQLLVEVAGLWRNTRVTVHVPCLPQLLYLRTALLCVPFVALRGAGLELQFPLPTDPADPTIPVYLSVSVWCMEPPCDVSSLHHPQQ